MDFILVITLGPLWQVCYYTHYIFMPTYEIKFNKISLFDAGYVGRKAFFSCIRKEYQNQLSFSYYGLPLSLEKPLPEKTKNLKTIYKKKIGAALNILKVSFKIFSLICPMFMQKMRVNIEDSPHSSGSSTENWFKMQVFQAITSTWALMHCSFSQK